MKHHEHSARIRELTNQLRALLTEAGADVRARFWKTRQAEFVAGRERVRFDVRLRVSTNSRSALRGVQCQVIKGKFDRR